MTTTTVSDRPDFSRLLKSWRAKLGVSQLELSLRCEVSQKHISFLESARSAPSASMVRLICEALDIPLRDRNALLLAAGFAPGYKESDLSAPELAAVERALTMMLDQQEPFPAMVIDRLYNVLRANRGAARLMGLLSGAAGPGSPPPFGGNLLRGLFHPDGFRRHIANWHEVASFLLRRLNQEVLSGAPVPGLRELLAELERCEGVPEDWKRRLPGERLAPMLTVDIARDGVRLSLFSTLATLGTPLDVTLQEILIESYFPADDATRDFFLDA